MVYTHFGAFEIVNHRSMQGTIMYKHEKQAVERLQSKPHPYVVNVFDGDYRVFLDYLIIGNAVVSHDGVCR